MKIPPADTIAAVATPPGEGAIAVIRISGPGALEVGDRIFRGTSPLSAALGYTLHHGTIVGTDGREVDEVLATVFRAPRSYTGEDCVEISCHGGVFVTNAVLNAALSAGGRRADPGEFTRRAFLNGKMDLSRAEAVAALISSRSERAHRASLEQLRGRLSVSVEELRTALQSLCALLEVDLDFSEEGISVIGKAEIESRIREVKEKLELLADTFKAGKVYRDGVSVVIVGPPNAGKSSLFNALLKESRAIVTPIAGTTRDYLEESLTLEGILFRITDTAGLRRPDNPVEAEGIARTLRSIESADVIIFVRDGNRPHDRDEMEFESLPIKEGQHVVRVRNKIDLLSGEANEMLARETHSGPWTGVSLSALKGSGVHELAKELTRIVAVTGVSSHETLSVISERHADSLLKGARSLATALVSLKSGMTNEFVAFDIRECVSTLGEITGEITSEEILNSVFGAFCIGK